MGPIIIRCQKKAEKSAFFKAQNNDKYNFAYSLL